MVSSLIYSWWPNAFSSLLKISINNIPCFWWKLLHKMQFPTSSHNHLWGKYCYLILHLRELKALRRVKWCAQGHRAWLWQRLQVSWSQTCAFPKTSLHLSPKNGEALNCMRHSVYTIRSPGCSPGISRLLTGSFNSSACQCKIIPLCPNPGLWGPGTLVTKGEGSTVESERVATYHLLSAFLQSQRNRGSQKEENS